MTGWLAVLVALVSTGSLLAHHALTNYDYEGRRRKRNNRPVSPN